MTDYSAFPDRKSSPKVWWVVPAVLILAFLFISVVLIMLPDEQLRANGLKIFQIVVYFVAVVGVLIIFVLPIWFIMKVLIPRLRNRLTGDYDAEVINPNFIQVNAQFARDNGFEFKEYTYRTPASEEYYKGLIAKNENDDVHLLYEITGSHAETNFQFYCLSIATNRYRGIKEGMAYAYQTDGRYVEYVTIMKVPKTIAAHVKRPIMVLNSVDAAYVYISGYVNDRDLIMKIFRALE